MDLERFTQVIETHGSKPADWPDSVRVACMNFLSTSDSAQDVHRQYQQLESELDKIAVPDFTELESRILRQQLPPQPTSILDRLINWLLPTGVGLQLWRPLTAACLPLVFGIAVGNYFSFGVNNENLPLETWDEELVLLSLNDLSTIAIEPLL
ncbi:MAG: hypothetical protein ACI95C_001662 [Pseudohongiellaceae bacterium]|jgi:hypothetical protein